MEKNKCYEVTIDGYTSEGAGVAHLEGMAVFIPGVIAGEVCKIRIEKIGRSAAYGKLVKVLLPSPHRQEPACRYAGRCGGCVFWHMDYEEECRLKALRVEDALTRIGAVQLGPVPIQGSAQITGYRNKAQYPVGRCGGRADAGFFRQRTHEIIPISHCKIQSESADAVREAVIDWMRRCRVSPYDETSGSGLIRHIFVRCAFGSEQVLACVVANGKKLPQEEILVQLLRQRVPELTTVVLGVNTRRGNAVLGEQFRTLWGPGYIEDVLCALRFRLSPRSFYQVNRDQAERLYQRAMELADLDGGKTVLDLYCGTGTITLCMARHVKQAIGVEIIPAAIEDAKENARRNGIENARFFCADAGEAAGQLAQEGVRPDVIVIDPPRKGISEAVIAAMVSMAPERIVYISCDPATLARDLRRLEAQGYRTRQAEAFDLFPRCAHVETVALLTRQTGPQTGTDDMGAENSGEKLPAVDPCAPAREL